MTFAQYSTSLRHIIDFLNKNSLSKISGLYHTKGESVKVDEKDNEENYFSVYKAIIDNHDYDVLLFDDSIIQFEYSKLEEKRFRIRYVYYEAPWKFQSYNEFLKKYGFSYEETGETFKIDYEQELSEADFNNFCVYMRYDYSEREYTLGVHPASHIHIGRNNTIKIPTSKIITPYLFVMFILKQVYYKPWIEYMGNTNFSRSFRSCKESCLGLKSSFFGNEDKLELYLT